MIVPWAPGGSNDVVARLLSPALEARLRQPFVVENRPGGGGSVGMALAMRARPDGLTVFISSASNHVFHPIISNELIYDVREVFQGVAMLADVPNVLAVNPSVPAHNVSELVAWIRTQRGGVAYGSSGVGSSNHLAGELFRMRTGADITHLPYRGGGPAMADLIGGTIPMAIMNLPTLIPPAEAGRVRLIGVGTAERVALKPDLPTIQEQGVTDYAVRSWTGAFLPRATPRAIIETLSAAFKEALDSPLARTRLRDIGSEPLFMDAATTDAFVREEYTRWGPVVRAANIRIE
jgi:tripartite-type tricarboxylate transporter receptor subunit TctC